MKKTAIVTDDIPNIPNTSIAINTNMGVHKITRVYVVVSKPNRGFSKLKLLTITIAVE